jgi:hypothetical protein
LIIECLVEPVDPDILELDSPHEEFELGNFDPSVVEDVLTASCFVCRDDLGYDKVASDIISINFDILETYGLRAEFVFRDIGVLITGQVDPELDLGLDDLDLFAIEAVVAAAESADVGSLEVHAADAEIGLPVSPETALKEQSCCH